MSSETRLESRYDEYWDWVAVALFLLLSIDLLTSMYAAGAVGVEHEANPLMAWLLGQSLGTVVTVMTALGICAAFLFYALFELTRALPPTYRRPVSLSIEGLLGVLVAIGLFAFANNLTVIVLGQSLV